MSIISSIRIPPAEGEGAEEENNFNFPLPIEGTPSVNQQQDISTKKSPIALPQDSSTKKSPTALSQNLEESPNRKLLPRAPLTVLKILVGVPLLVAKAGILIPLSVITVPTYRLFKNSLINKDTIQQFTKLQDAKNETADDVKHLTFEIKQLLNKQTTYTRVIDEISFKLELLELERQSLESQKEEKQKIAQSLPADSRFSDSYSEQITKLDQTIAEITKDQDAPRRKLHSTQKELEQLEKRLNFSKKNLTKQEAQLALLETSVEPMRKYQSRLNKVHAFSYHRLTRDALMLQARPFKWSTALKMVLGVGVEPKTEAGVPLSLHKQTQRSWKNFTSSDNSAKFISSELP